MQQQEHIVQTTSISSNGNGQVTDTETPKYPFVIETKGRGIKLGGGYKKKLDPDLTLESIRDKVVGWTKGQDRVDHSFGLNMYHYDFANGTARLALKRSKVGGQRLDEPLYFTRHGFGQLMRELLPNRGGHNMEETVKAHGEMGQKLSSMYVNLWASKNDNQRLLRTMKTRQPNGDIVRVARSLHSSRYATYDNAEFLTDLLDHSSIGNTQVIDFRLHDNAMRLRFTTEKIDRIELNKPIPMFEVWNSEVGLRSTGLRAGAWKLVCFNGLTTFEKRKDFSWRHYGDSTRIRQGVDDALHTLEADANGILRQYNRALETHINDAFAFLEAELAGLGATSEFIDRADKAMRDETSSEIGSLAGVVDGITLAAQHLIEDRSTADLLEQSIFEQMATRIMDRGLRQSENGRILVEA